MCKMLVYMSFFLLPVDVREAYIGCMDTALLECHNLIQWQRSGLANDVMNKSSSHECVCTWVWSYFEKRR